MANTTWSTTDKSGGVTLSGGNLIATNTATTGWVRAIDKQVTGKFYWECKPTSWASNNTGIGVCPDSTASPSGATAAGLTAVFKSGNIYVDAVNTGSTLGARAVNDVISVAFDFGARLVWYRAAPSGSWNGNASANPATGVGGILVPIVGAGIPGFPLATFGINTDAITANFGDTAFTGTPPSGFTSGFTTGASVPTNALASQVSAEHWLTTNPQAQITQVVLEHWMSVAEGTPVVPSLDTRAMILA